MLKSLRLQHFLHTQQMPQALRMQHMLHSPQILQMRHGFNLLNHWNPCDHCNHRYGSPTDRTQPMTAYWIRNHFRIPFRSPANSLVAWMLSCSIPILHLRFIREEPERMAFSAIDMLFTQRIDGKRTFSQTLQFSRKSEYRIIGA